MKVPSGVRAVTDRVVAWCRELPPNAILVAAWACSLLYAFPGVMTIDSCDQLHEARKNFYTDGHPPVMAKMWRYIDQLVPGPLGMFAIQTFAFLFGANWILRRTFASRRAAVATALLFLFPPVLAAMAVIWKDSLMAGMFLLGIAGLLSERRRDRLLGLFALFVGTAVRWNAFAATAPLIVLLFEYKPMTWWKRYALSFAVWVGVTGAALGINFAVVDVQMHYWTSSLAVLDTVGTLDHVDGTLPDDELRELFAGTEILVDKDIHAAIRTQYRAGDFDQLLVGEGHLWNLPVSGTTPAPQAQRDAIARTFWQVVTTYPGAYLQHRARLMGKLLGLSKRKLSSLVRTHDSQSIGHLINLHVPFHWSALQQWLDSHMRSFASRSSFFRPFVYLVVSLVLLPLCWRQRDMLALVLSGLGLEASLFFLAPTPDFRYSHWMVVTTMIAVLVVAARRLRQGAAETDH